MIIAYFIKFIFALPVLFADNCFKNEGDFKLSPFIKGIYAVILLGFICYDISKFCHFASECPVPEFSLPVISAIAVISAFYCSLKGIRGVLRGGVVVFGAVIFMTGIMCLILTGRINPENLNPAVYSFSADKAVKNSLYLSLSGAEVPVLFLLSGDCKNGILKPFVIWNTVSSAVFAVLLFVTAATLGAFGQTQLYPVYTAFNAGSVGALRRFDAIFISVWLLSLIIKMSLILAFLKEWEALLQILSLPPLFLPLAVHREISVPFLMFFTRIIFRRLYCLQLSFRYLF